MYGTLSEYHLFKFFLLKEKPSKRACVLSRVSESNNLLAPYIDIAFQPRIRGESAELSAICLSIFNEIAIPNSSNTVLPNKECKLKLVPSAMENKPNFGVEPILQQIYFY